MNKLTKLEIKKKLIERARCLPTISSRRLAIVLKKQGCNLSTSLIESLTMDRAESISDANTKKIADFLGIDKAFIFSRSDLRLSSKKWVNEPIKKAIILAGGKVSLLCELSGVSAGVINKLVLGTGKTSHENLAKIAKSVGMDMSELDNLIGKKGNYYERKIEREGVRVFFNKNDRAVFSESESQPHEVNQGIVSFHKMFIGARK